MYVLVAVVGFELGCLFLLWELSFVSCCFGWVGEWGRALCPLWGRSKTETKTKDKRLTTKDEGQRA
jgi:hypothetical protein